MAVAPGKPFPAQSMTWILVMSSGMQVVLAWIYPIAVLSIAAILMLFAFRQSIVFFHTPSDVAEPE